MRYAASIFSVRISGRADIYASAFLCSLIGYIVEVPSLSQLNDMFHAHTLVIREIIVLFSFLKNLILINTGIEVPSPICIYRHRLRARS